MSLYVVMLGPPGAGKGTQAQRIASRYQVPHISTGDMFRAMQHDSSDLARRVRLIMARGDLVPDDLTLEIVRRRLQQPDALAGAVLDGFPRTVEQAEGLSELLAERGAGVNVAFLLNVPESALFERIRGRAGDEGRSDDTESAMHHRYEVYQRKTAPLIDYYRRQGRLVEIDGNRPIAVVTNDLLAHLAMVTPSD